MLIGLKGHLMRSFPAHWRLYQVLEKRNGPPTLDEIDIARGKKVMDKDVAKVYMEELDNISNNIRSMLERQAAVSQVYLISFYHFVLFII
jgi:hypothetical protein